MGNWARDDFNTSLIGLTIFFILGVISYQAYHKYGLRYCAICGRDLKEGDGLSNGKPVIPACDYSGRIIGAACPSCVVYERLENHHPPD